MIKVKNQVVARFYCNKCNYDEEIITTNLDEAVKIMASLGWEFNQIGHPARTPKDVKNLLCTKCKDAKNKELRESSNLREMLQGGKVIDAVEFKRLAISYVGLQNHPKADKVFAKAWDEGHSSGYMEVLNYLEDLADLVH